MVVCSKVHELFSGHSCVLVLHCACKFSDVQMYRIHGTVVYLSMSADASCRGLRSPRDGPTVLELTQGRLSGYDGCLYAHSALILFLWPRIYAQYFDGLHAMPKCLSAMCNRYRLKWVLWHCWLGVRKGIRPVKTWLVFWWCMVICLQLCASLHRCHLHHLLLY